jgi:hypothetical protein
MCSALSGCQGPFCVGLSDSEVYYTDFALLCQPRSYRFFAGLFSAGVLQEGAGQSFERLSRFPSGGKIYSNTLLTLRQVFSSTSLKVSDQVVEE